MKQRRRAKESRRMMRLAARKAANPAFLQAVEAAAVRELAVDGFHRRDGESLMDLICRACACTPEQIDVFLARLADGATVPEAEETAGLGNVPL